MSKIQSVNFKPVLIIGMFLLSLAGNSLLVAAETGEPSYSSGDIDTMNEAAQLESALGQMFGMFREFGASGDTFAMVFEMLFNNFANMTTTQKMKGVYVLNASIVGDQESGSFEYGNGSTWDYEPWGVYNCDNATLEEDQDEFPYFIMNETGILNYNKTEGASITFIIWDQDGSFIEAIDKIISTGKVFMEIERKEKAGTLNDEEAQAEAIENLVSAITYFLIHINDIITGDEVIIFNVIAFTNYEADFAGTLEGQWYITEDGIKTNDRKLNDTIYPNWENEYKDLAEFYNDQWMLSILNKDYLEKRYQNYTQFSFDIIEIWLKQFQVSIDVEAILGAVNNDEDAFAGKEATDIFQELKVEFYIFTHHFQNFYLFDDDKYNGKTYDDPIIQAQADAAVGNGVPDVLFKETGTYENETISKISDTEAEDYLLFRGADEWIFNEPTYDFTGDTEKMEWGIRGENLAFRIIPIGMKDDEVNETVAPIEHMEYMELGFTFEPWKQLDVETGDYLNGQGTKSMGCAKVKLVHSFGQWDLDTDGKPFTPKLKDNELDLATVYMSAILHFKLEIENKKIIESGEEIDQALLDESNYNKSSNKINVGDIKQELPLSEIDIAGPEYEQTPFGGTTVSHPAKTTTIPTVFAEWEGKNSETYTQNDTSTGRINSTVNVEFALIIYAVSYDTFDSSGDEIIHDPEFSIFIVTENPGIIAVILVVGSVILVGVAAVVITKKKNSAF